MSAFPNISNGHNQTSHASNSYLGNHYRKNYGLPKNSRKKRESWFDPQIDKSVEIEKVKDMVRQIKNPQDAILKSIQTHENNILPALPLLKTTNYVENIPIVEFSNSIAPAAEFLNIENGLIPRPPIRSKSTPVINRHAIIPPLPIPPKIVSTASIDSQTAISGSDLQNQKNTIKDLETAISLKSTTLKNIYKVASEKIDESKRIAPAILNYCLENNLDSTVDCLKKDALLDDSTFNHICLHFYIQKLDFRRALVFVEYIYLVQINQLEVAKNTLQDIIWPIVDKEQKRGGIRASWFYTDFKYLDALLNSADQDEDNDNIYQRLNWETEIRGFWGAAQSLSTNQKSSPPPPLYAYVLVEHFWTKKTKNEVSALIEVFNNSEKWKLVEKELSNHSVLDKKIKSKFPIAKDASGNRSSKETPKNLQNSIHRLDKLETLKGSKSNERQDSKPANSITTYGIIDVPNNYIDDKYSQLSTSKESLMPPIKFPETADFALTNTCGPAIDDIRALDVCEQTHDLKQVIATAGGDSRSDRCISLWDIKTGTLIKRLDNKTSKPIVILYFHPIHTSLLFSADMEFDIKLWDWTTGELMNHWKKHHSRIIYRICLVPGTQDLMASCSSDQSLKLWNIQDSDMPIQSVHANEPITSFVFCGPSSDPGHRKLVVSLSYCIRLYKLRTMGLLHTISLKELKQNKTPITCIQSHPQYDNYILISCDNQLRLFELTTETTLRVFSTRHIEPGIRVEGRFSPFGLFVYCGGCDIRGLRISKNQSSCRFPGKKSCGNSVFIWKVQTGNLAIDEMRALNSNDDISPIIFARWTMIPSGNSNTKRKTMVLATVEKMLNIYL